MPKQTAREASIVASVLKYLAGVEGCRAIKVHGGPYGQSGQPDITGCFRGQRFDLEAKRPGQKPTALQVREMERWKAAGSVVAVVYSVEDARNVIDGMKLAQGLAI